MLSSRWDSASPGQTQLAARRRALAGPGDEPRARRASAKASQRASVPSSPRPSTLLSGSPPATFFCKYSSTEVARRNDSPRLCSSVNRWSAKPMTSTRNLPMRRLAPCLVTNESSTLRSLGSSRSPSVGKKIVASALVDGPTLAFSQGSPPGWSSPAAEPVTGGGPSSRPVVPNGFPPKLHPRVLPEPAQPPRQSVELPPAERPRSWVPPLRRHPGFDRSGSPVRRCPSLVQNARQPQADGRRHLFAPAAQRPRTRGSEGQRGFLISQIALHEGGRNAS